MTGEALLSVRDLTAGSGAIQILRDVSLAVFPGEIVCVVGANGV